MLTAHRFLIDRLLIAVTVVMAVPTIGLGDTMPASELSERVSLSVRSIKNVSFVVTWNDSIDGGSLQYSTLKTVYDSLGRIRVTEIDKGSYDEAGKKMPSRKGRRDKLFDGEKSVVLNTLTDLDDAGKPIFAPSGIYRHAVIADAMDGPSKWRTSDRNPLVNNPQHLLTHLERLAQLSQVVEANPAQYEGEQAVIVRFKQGGLDVTATLSPTWSWALRELIQKDSTGKTTKHFCAEYTRTKEGLCLPTRGTIMFLHRKMEMPFKAAQSGKMPKRLPNNRLFIRS